MSKEEEWILELSGKGIVEKVMRKYQQSGDNADDLRQIVWMSLWKNRERVYKELSEEAEKLVTGGEKVSDQVGEELVTGGEKVSDRLMKLSEKYIVGMVHRQVRSLKSRFYYENCLMGNRYLSLNEAMDFPIDDDEPSYMNKYAEVMNIIHKLGLNEVDKDILFTLSQEYYHNDLVEDLMERYHLTKRQVIDRWNKIKRNIRETCSGIPRLTPLDGVIMLDYDTGEEIARYKNQTDCYRHTGIGQTTIGRIIKGARKSAKLNGKKVFFKLI